MIGNVRSLLFVVEERPEQVAKVSASHTGRFLAGALIPAPARNGGAYVSFGKSLPILACDSFLPYSLNRN